jgi:predicted phage terminase large subunit-like protein
MSYRAFDALLRTDFLAFYRKVFDTLNPGTPYLDNWHINAIAHALEEVRAGRNNRLIINVPPRHLKSTIVSVALPAFLLGNDTSKRIMCVSYSQTLSAKLSRDAHQIMTSDWFRRAFPHTMLGKETEELLETTRGGCRFATSVGASITGFGGDYIIIDDPLKPDEAPSEAARNRVKDHYRQTLYSRLDDKVNGKIIIVAQRLHDDDLCGHLMRDGDFTSLVIPAIATENQTYDLVGGRKYHRKAGEVLHPEREPRSVLENLQRTVGAAAFAAQYQQDPVPPDGNMLKPAWIKTYRTLPSRDGGQLVLSLDTAMKGDPANDYSVGTIWLNKEGKRYLIEVVREKLDFPRLLNEARSLISRYAPNAVLIEDKGSGTSLAQTLKLEGYPAIIPIKVPSSTDKVSRFAAVLPMFEAGDVLFPEDAPWLPDLQRELFGFPHARYDDQVDSVSQYLNWVRTRTSSMLVVDWMNDDDGTPSAEDILGWRRFG